MHTSRLHSFVSREKRLRKITRLKIHDKRTKRRIRFATATNRRFHGGDFAKETNKFSSFSVFFFERQAREIKQFVPLVARTAAAILSAKWRVRLETNAGIRVAFSPPLHPVHFVYTYIYYVCIYFIYMYMYIYYIYIRQSLSIL